MIFGCSAFCTHWGCGPNSWCGLQSSGSQGQPGWRCPAGALCSDPTPAAVLCLGPAPAGSALVSVALLGWDSGPAALLGIIWDLALPSPHSSSSLHTGRDGEECRYHRVCRYCPPEGWPRGLTLDSTETAHGAPKEHVLAGSQCRAARGSVPPAPHRLGAPPLKALCSGVLFSGPVMGSTALRISKCLRGYPCTASVKAPPSIELVD